MEKENIIDKLQGAEMLYFVLGSLISADTLVDVESCHRSLDGLEILKRDFETSKLKDDATIRAFLVDAEKIILRDLHEFERN
jgi:hypothetical protein